MERLIFSILTKGSQFTSFEWIDILKEHKVKVSMDGKGRWMDNVFIERLWRSVKYECVFLYAIETGEPPSKSPRKMV